MFDPSVCCTTGRFDLSIEPQSASSRNFHPEQGLLDQKRSSSRSTRISSDGLLNILWWNPNPPEAYFFWAYGFHVEHSGMETLPISSYYWRHRFICSHSVLSYFTTSTSPKTNSRSVVGTVHQALAVQDSRFGGLAKSIYWGEWQIWYVRFHEIIQQWIIPSSSFRRFDGQ